MSSNTRSTRMVQSQPSQRIQMLCEGSKINRLALISLLSPFLNIPNRTIYTYTHEPQFCLAISSRSLTYFDYLQSPEVKQSIINRISDFFVDVVLHHFQLSDCIVISFASHPTLDSFQLAFSKKTNIDEILGTITVSFDVYLKNPTKSSSDHNKRLRPNLKVLDFNPLASYSDPYLFSFHELKSFNHFSSLPELRLVNQPGLASRFESSRIPIDLIYCSQGNFSHLRVFLVTSHRH